MIKKYKDFLRLVIYQIYPRSFQDTNHDGIGDIKGIIERLDYIKSLGANVIWIGPCYKSPNDDNGYDISDYRDIMDEFGTLEDIKQLICEMHQRGMKLIMDLVPNHTSTEHPWFQESRKSKDNPYSDYYYWFDEPQNDWQSCFGGTAWEYDEMRGQYYLHSYAISQAALNWNNPKVVKEMQDIVDYWIGLGVDGFRCDVIDQISKDFENNCNAFGPRLHEFIHALFGRENTENIFTIGECWCDSIEELCKHTGPERGELSTVFQFDHLDCGRKEKWWPRKADMREVRDILLKWGTLSEENGLIYTLFTDNHDNSRFINRVTENTPLRYEAASCIATMVYLLKGIPVIYQGQEFGTMAPSYDTIDAFNDVESKNYYKDFCKSMTPQEALERINFGSRDNNRRPMCWDDSQYGGFSDVQPWIKMHSEAQEINLKADIDSEKSVFLYYQKLLSFRKSCEAILDGSLTVLSNAEDNYFAYIRELGTEKILVVCNFEERTNISIWDGQCDLIISNYLTRKIPNGLYEPYETAVFRLSTEM